MTEIQNYQQQFERVKRFYGLFEKIDKGIKIDFPLCYLEDVVYAFFIFCYHLKDWIKNDNTLSSNIKDKIEDFVTKNKCLGICGDICNGVKHLALDKSRGGEYGEIKTKKVFAEYAGGTSLNVKIKFNVFTKSPRGKQIDAFDLATESLKKWEEFIKENVLSNRGY